MNLLGREKIVARLYMDIARGVWGFYLMARRTEKEVSYNFQFKADEVGREVSLHQRKHRPIVYERAELSFF